MCISELRGLRGHGRNVYIIHDVSKEGTPPPRHFAPTSGWGMIAVPFPKVANYDEWAKQLQASRIIVNCHAEMDVKAMCAWMKRDGTAEKQAECWKMVEKHMDMRGRFHVTSLMRMSSLHTLLHRGCLEWINSRDGGKYFTHVGVRPWDSEALSQKLVRLSEE
ncbi:putative retrotransposon hot spot protein (RHS) [Trypanosoma cruzi]|uniref:Putative retrotransposon hot spot protein (RHS) n=1 Tax=Trypanosoma cruzi TaxID=5693 RepID=A0A2V2W6Y5_TRYCR|nr:putative retrotransposon hot spot protein (RHS) [Trypanosoma cruzi]